MDAGEAASSGGPVVGVVREPPRVRKDVEGSVGDSEHSSAVVSVGQDPSGLSASAKSTDGDQYCGVVCDHAFSRFAP
jgi:hypothetical protein